LPLNVSKHFIRLEEQVFCGDLILLDKAKQAILTSVDRALSSFDFVDKEQLYSIFWRDYGLQREDIGEQYDEFHKLLIDLYGVRHFRIERQIVKELHQSSKTGEFVEVNEIPAFASLIESYFKETDQAVKENKTKMQETEDKLKLIEQKQKEWNQQNKRKNSKG